MFCFFKHKTAYDMRISDWSSDVCSSDLHVTRKVPLRYEATLWSIIFPLGMYAVAGIYLGQADNLPVVGLVGRVELWVALAAWFVVAVAGAEERRGGKGWVSRGRTRWERFT